MEGDAALLQSAATFLLDLSAALLAGASISALWLARGQSAWSAQRLPLLRRWAIGASLVSVFGSLAVLCLEAASMAEVPIAESAPAIKAMLSSTHYGTAWYVGTAALGLATVIHLALPLRFTTRAAVATLAALVVFWYARSDVSHAAAAGDISVPVAVDWIHLCLVSLWLGEVAIAGFTILTPAEPLANDARRDRAAYVNALSSSATLGLAGIFATGLYSAWHNLGGWDRLTGTTYGLTLLAKIALVGGAALLGGVNRFFVMPSWSAIERSGATAPLTMAWRFRWIVLVEILVLAGALALAVTLAAM
jgi:copper resistance protein D